MLSIIEIVSIWYDRDTSPKNLSKRDWKNLLVDFFSNYLKQMEQSEWRSWLALARGGGGGGGGAWIKKFHVGETVSPMRVFFSMWPLSFLST